MEVDEVGVAFCDHQRAEREAEVDVVDGVGGSCGRRSGVWDADFVRWWHLP